MKRAGGEHTNSFWEQIKEASGVMFHPIEGVLPTGSVRPAQASSPYLDMYVVGYAARGMDTLNVIMISRADSIQLT